MKPLNEISESAIVEGTEIKLVAMNYNGNTVFEWLKSEVNKKQVVNHFVFPRGRQDLNSLINQDQYASGTVWSCTVGHVCDIKPNGHRIVILFDVNEDPIHIVKPHVGLWEIGSEYKILVCKDQKDPNNKILKPDITEDSITFFNLSEEDKKRVQESYPDDAWVVRVHNGSNGNTSMSGKKIYSLSCTLIGEKPIRRRLHGGFYSDDEILVRVNTVSGKPQISGCQRGDREVVFQIDNKSSDKESMEALLSHCSQGDQLVLKISGSCLVGPKIIVFGEIKKAELADIKRINQGGKAA
ncbi:MAG: hypothetical protein PHH83_00745 [Patescibacteria group bacterium]|nr:hypothetical protein [Patescibacteria group bacterium]